MEQIKKKPLSTWLLTAMILLYGILLVGCGSDDFSVTMITTNGEQQQPVADKVVVVVTVPVADEAASQYTATIPAEGKSVLTLLEEMGKTEGFAVITGSGYVTSIDGVAQFDMGPESGWLYLVNGQMASVGADQYIPQANDVINWIYITSYDQLNNFESLE